MSKDFLLKCIKTFLKSTIPALITLITVFSLFSSNFEDTLKKFGIFGAIVVCLLCFSLTLLYGLIDMTKFVDFIGDEYLQDSKFDKRYIYNFYNIYQIEEKKKKRNEKINTHNNFYKYKQIAFSNKQLSINDFYYDAQQEISFVAMASGTSSLSDFFDIPIKLSVPESLNDINILDLRNSIELNYILNVLVNFYGGVSGCILLCLDENIKNMMNALIINDYLEYINRQNYNYYMTSFLCELGNIFAGSCVTTLFCFLALPVMIHDIQPNINVNYLQLPKNKEKISAIKLKGTNNGQHLFTSYMIFNETNAYNLIKNSFNLKT